jgi:MATE family multidrug resistance protein
VGSRLLVIAAAFQLFDGLQVVSTGVLRGLGDTRTPMLGNLVAHWGVGLPVGCLLAFAGGQGIFGLWVGLSAGLIGVAVFLVFTWKRRIGRLGEGSPAEPAGQIAGEDTELAAGPAAGSLRCSGPGSGSES